MNLIRNRGLEARAAEGRRGAIIVIFLALVMTVAGVGMVLMRAGLSTTSRQGLALDGKNSFYLAESALAESYWGLKIGKTGQVGTKTDPIYFGGGLFWVDSFPQGDDVYLLQATGMYGRGSTSLSLAVRATAQDNAGASLGVFSNQSIDVAPGVEIDGYDSNGGTYEEQLDPAGLPTVLGSLASNGGITLSGDASNPVVIQGDVKAGPESTVSEGTGNTVTGVVASLPELATVDPVVVPTYNETPLSMTVTPMMPRKLSGADTEIDTLTIGNGGLLRLEGPLNLVVDELYVQPGGDLVVDSASGEVNLYVRTRAELYVGSFASTTSTDPWQFRLRAAADDPATAIVEGLYLQSNGAVYGIVEGPETTIEVGTGFELFGAVTGDSVSLGEDAKLHVDVSTMQGAVSDIRMVPDGVLLWQIVSLPDVAVAGGDPFKTLGVVKTALDMPYDGHKVLWLSVDYLDDTSTAQTWSGWSTDADPSMLRKVSRVEAYTNQGDVTPIYVKTVNYVTTDTGKTVGSFDSPTLP